MAAWLITYHLTYLDGRWTLRRIEEEEYAQQPNDHESAETS